MNDSRSPAAQAEADRTKGLMSDAVARAKAPRQEVSLADNQMIDVLRSSLYPGARPESIMLVLLWCQKTGRDPLKKPIHIVPMYVKDAMTGRGEYRDVLMPGIGTYRSDAASSGEYAGKSEPEFGPDVDGIFTGNVKVTYPKWCKITVQRLVGGQIREFTAKEFWTENYASAGRDTDVPNTMWKKRPYGQLAKCAESQALRMAFPDETGNTNTAEEMEGKDFVGVTIDHGSPRSTGATASEPETAEAEIDPAMVAFTDATCKLFANVKTAKAREALALEIQDNLDILRAAAPALAKRIMDAALAASERLQSKPAQQPPEDPDAFEHFPVDEIGEPVGSNPITTPQAFAEWFELAAGSTTNIEELRENNMDAIADAGTAPAAALMISEAIAAAVKRTASASAASNEEAKPEPAQPAVAEPLPIPKTSGRKPHWPNYLENAKAVILGIQSEADLAAWRALNRPAYQGSPIEAGVERALRERASAIDPQITPPAGDADAEWATASVEHIKTISYDDAVAWAMGAIPQAKMPRLKAERPELYSAVRDAIDNRRE